jgi:formylglycine-generating enzyme required for sulfatase activity
VVESRFELKMGSPFRPTDVQLGLYCEGEEVAVGYADAQGKWAVRVEGLKRPAEELIFEAHARLSLKRARSERKVMYEVRQGALSALEVADQSRTQRDPQLDLVLPELTKIRAGNFWMGRSATAHRVRIPRPIMVGVTPVTQALYEVVMGENPSHFKGERRPVEQVSFWEALEFCNKLSALEGESAPYRLYEEGGRRCVEWLRSSKGYRLLTEAEWEYCAKAGREGLYAGNLALGDLAWYQDNARGRTHTVGQKEPNDWGLYDMSGNVWEWCFDEWDEAAYDHRFGEQQLDPVVAHKPSASKRVRRGGCWLAFAASCGVSNRFSGSATQQTDDTGFRVARTL